MTDDEVLALAQPALRRMPGGDYRQAPRDKTGLTVPSKDVRRLVEKGALLWVNRCRSAAARASLIVEGPRCLSDILRPAYPSGFDPPRRGGSSMDL